MGAFARLFRSVRAFQRGLKQGTDQLDSAPRPVSIGLALGGGFARGLAHIGVLKVLEQENIPINYLAGTSVGALIAAVYASGVSPPEMEETAGQIRFKDFARWTVSRLGFATNDRMSGMLQRFLKVKTFEELRIPLAVTTTDFSTGQPVVFRSGPLIDPIRASCAYPGMFLPVQIDGRMLVDGMLAYSVPAPPLREMGAERVIAVYLRAHWVNGAAPRHVFDVIGQCFSIAQVQACSLWQAEADLIMEPEMGSFAYDSFERAPELVRLGEEAARQALPRIREWLTQPAPVAADFPRGAAGTVPHPAPLKP